MFVHAVRVQASSEWGLLSYIRPQTWKAAAARPAATSWVIPGTVRNFIGSCNDRVCFCFHVFCICVCECVPLCMWRPVQVHVHVGTQAHACANETYWSVNRATSRSCTYAKNWCNNPSCRVDVWHNPFYVTAANEVDLGHDLLIWTV